jgi:hypothetical protein
MPEAAAFGKPEILGNSWKGISSLRDFGRMMAVTVEKLHLA